MPERDVQREESSSPQTTGRSFDDVDERLVVEIAADEMIGERLQQGERGAIHHYALTVDSRAALEVVKERLAAAGAQEVGEIQLLGDGWSLFFRDPDGMELEVCCAADS